MLCVFPKKNKILKNWEYKKIGKTGHRYVSPHFVLLCLSSDHIYPRLGITVGRKVGNAVVRNASKRIIREFFRMNIHNIKPKNYIIIVRRNLIGVDKNVLSTELTGLFYRD